MRDRARERERREISTAMALDLVSSQLTWDMSVSQPCHGPFTCSGPSHRWDFWGALGLAATLGLDQRLQWLGMGQQPPHLHRTCSDPIHTGDVWGD